MQVTSLEQSSVTVWPVNSLRQEMEAVSKFTSGQKFLSHQGSYSVCTSVLPRDESDSGILVGAFCNERAGSLHPFPFGKSGTNVWKV